MDPRDQDTFDAFARRFARIDRHVAGAPGLRTSPRRAKSAIRGAIATATALAIVAVLVSVAGFAFMSTLKGSPAEAPTQPGTASGSNALPAGSSPDAALPTVDRNPEPVSLSHPSEGAAEALRLCIPDANPDMVSGMGMVASARDVYRYGWFWGNPPELETDSPAWIVQVDGDLSSRLGTYHDPICVVIDGNRTIFATGGMTTLNGETIPRSQDAKAPELALPPLEP